LDVGTGFHPELTGRENIYLNGAILGMRRTEIGRRFAEIAEFAEIDKFLDTPVKHYSSGMYVRLAFAVAAHLEPEILFVDEVLAVGDAQFQAKCLGKIGEISRTGRTIMFVSHNMGAVRALCTTGLLLSDGRVVHRGSVDSAVSEYLSSASRTTGKAEFSRRPEATEAYVRSIELGLASSEGPVARIAFQEPFSIHIVVESDRDLNAVLGVALRDQLNQVITTVHTAEIGEEDTQKAGALTQIWAGPNVFTLSFAHNHLRPGTYYLDCALFNRRLLRQYDRVDQGLVFEVTDSNETIYFDHRQQGLVFYRDLVWARH
jgi:lipopolysaccharide transport system ATP-binding protein